MKRLLSPVLILLLLAAAGASGLWHQHQRFLQTPLQIENKGLVLDVKTGANIRTVIAILESSSATHLDWHWRLLARMQRTIIKAGEYHLAPGLMPAELLELLASGKVLDYRFTIIEGWTVKQLLLELGKDPVLEHTVDSVADLNNALGLFAKNPEGWFLPETYAFVRGDTDVQLLQRANQAMTDSLGKAWAGRDTGLPYETSDEMLTMASIIEKETSLASERATIAGVFVRRLQKHWRLETDPTVIYGMGDAYDGNIRRKDMKKDTPYNTYTRHGLPP
ncbi:MAG: endolytic transglycosylase MltG, partial [Xanthomonadales bacterium]|nr:endolytic transglycosylase MltG [Xanthomonadales bacterium]